MEYHFKMIGREEVELPDDGIDWDEGASYCGTTPRQTMYVRHYLLCENQTEAARRAGYGGTDGSLRSLASQTHNSESVQRLLGWAAIKTGKIDEGCNLAALRRRMTAIMNSSNGPGAVQAARFLKEILDIEEQERSNHRESNPLDTLHAISKVSPLLAMAIARRDGMGWDLPKADLPKAISELRSMNEIVASTIKANAAAMPAAEAKANGGALIEA